MQNSSPPDLIYGFDALCGWCYGAIPAMRALLAKRPDFSVQVIHGGLVTGARVGPYSEMVEYIRGASARMSDVTGQELSSAFFDLISSEPPIVSGSAKPAWAIMQMREIAPENELALAHLVQEAHFRDGRDLNDPNTYHHICAVSDMPELDLEGLEGVTEATPLVISEFGRAAAMGISSFPTVLARAQEGSNAYAKLPSIYEPGQFVSMVEQHLAGIAA
ncbi:MAG: hypothetical protein AAFY73_00395 [Pseudomonadota bacterium]